MSSPDDTTYASALKWARGNDSGSKNGPVKNDTFFWIALLILLTVIIGMYWYMKKLYDPIIQDGPITTLNTDISHPAMSLDSLGRIQVK